MSIHVGEEYVTPEELEERPDYFDRLWLINRTAYNLLERGFPNARAVDRHAVVTEDPVISSYTTDLEEVERDMERLGNAIHDNVLPFEYVYDIEKEYLATVWEQGGSAEHLSEQNKDYYLDLFTRERLKMIGYKPPQPF